MMHQLPQLLKDIRIKKAVYIVKDCSSVFCKVTLKVFSLQNKMVGTAEALSLTMAIKTSPQLLRSPLLQIKY